MAQVKFKFGTFDEYTSAEPKEQDALYFTTDTLQLFKGDKEYSKPAKLVDELPESGVVGEVYVVKATGATHVWDGSAFKQISYELTKTVGEVPSDTKVPTEKAVNDAIQSAVEKIEGSGGEITWEPIA